MKTRNLIAIFVVLAAVALFLHLCYPALSVSVSTSHAAFVQNSLKSIGYQASIEADKPQAAGKINVISFNDPVFHNELMQLHREFAIYLGSYQREHGVILTDKQQFNIARALAVARLSQTLYEAEIARVDDSDPALLKISVPSYVGEGGGIRDFLIEKITKSSQDPVLAKDMTDHWAGNFSRYGEFPQNMEITQKVITGDNGRLLTHVMLLNKTAVKTMSGLVVPMTVYSAFSKNQMYEYAPFAAFLK